MTIPQILIQLRPSKHVSRPQLYVYIKRFGIEPLGVRQCPQQYPEDTPQQILLKLGLTPAPHNGTRKSKRVRLSKSRR